MTGLLVMTMLRITNLSALNEVVIIVFPILQGHAPSPILNFSCRMIFRTFLRVILSNIQMFVWVMKLCKHIVFQACLKTIKDNNIGWVFSLSHFPIITQTTRFLLMPLVFPPHFDPLRSFKAKKVVFNAPPPRNQKNSTSANSSD